MKQYIKIITIILLGTLAVLSLSQCDNGKKKNNNTQGSNNTVLKQTEYSFDNPPVFRRDGELMFIDTETEETLFHIDIEVASTDLEKARGLMFRAEMEEKRGMLFLFAREQMQSFYMRNTLIPLDIIYVNSDRVIVDMYKSTNTLDETSLPSAELAMYVVEINAGLCDKYGIDIGDKIIF